MLGSLLKTLVNKNGANWDLKLCHAEFAYNRAQSYATKVSPFECVYGINPCVPISLVELPKEIVTCGDAKMQAEEMIKVLKKSNATSNLQTPSTRRGRTKGSMG